jgi:hypothetical protein
LGKIENNLKDANKPASFYFRRKMLRDDYFVRNYLPALRKKRRVVYPAPFSKDFAPFISYFQL